MRRPDHHNEVELNFLESGSVTYLLGGNKTTVAAGKLSVFWAAIPHQVIDFGDETAYYVATIPLQCFLQWRLPENFGAGCSCPAGGGAAGFHRVPDGGA